MISTSRNIYLFLAFYFVLVLAVAPINILSLDTYYYWDWSRHLALSYYDGSPMIAYFIKFATLLFGDTFFALSFVGICVMAISCTLIYKSARFFLSAEASWFATLAWLLSPLATMDILKQTTYDTPLTLFWASTIYFTIKFIHQENLKELYFIGASLGFMMLSKYTGVVLILALLIFLIFSSYRTLFKSLHFYCAILLALIIFSPVLLWNYQNHWQSFSYQLTTHQLPSTLNPFYNAAKTFFTLLIPSLNVMLLPPFFVTSKHLHGKNALIIRLCRIICFTFLCFYLYTATNAEIRVFWLTPYLVSSSLLFGYWLTLFPYRKLATSLIIFYGLVSLCILIDNTSKFYVIKSKKLVFYHLMQQFSATYPQLPSIVLTSGWFQARMMFFLKNKPAIYTLGCGTAQNQYALWSTDINKKIINKTLKEILYIDRYDRQGCLNQYFDHCEQIPTQTYSFRHKEYALSVYRCQNSDHTS